MFSHYLLAELRTEGPAPRRNRIESESLDLYLDPTPGPSGAASKRKSEGEDKDDASKRPRHDYTKTTVPRSKATPEKTDLAPRPMDLENEEEDLFFTDDDSAPPPVRTDKSPLSIAAKTDSRGQLRLGLRVTDEAVRLTGISVRVPAGVDEGDQITVASKYRPCLASPSNKENEKVSRDEAKEKFAAIFGKGKKLREEEERKKAKGQEEKNKKRQEMFNRARGNGYYAPNDDSEGENLI